MGPIFFSPGDSHTITRIICPTSLVQHGELCLLRCLLRCLFVSTPSNDRVLCVYTPSGYSTREQLARGRFFRGLHNYMENKNEGNENKITLRDFNCIMDTIHRYGGNKAQRLYRCCSNYSFIVDNGLRIYGEGRTQILPSSPARSYDRSLGKDPG